MSRRIKQFRYAEQKKIEYGKKAADSQLPIKGEIGRQSCNENKTFKMHEDIK